MILQVAGERLGLQLEERLVKLPHVVTPAEQREAVRPWGARKPPKWDYVPDGRLSFRLEHMHHLFRGRAHWTDTKATPLEQQLGRVVVGIELAARAQTALRAEEARREAERLAQERQRLEVLQAVHRRMDRVGQGLRSGTRTSVGSWLMETIFRKRGIPIMASAGSGESVTWALDPGTAEALRRWRSICPSKVWVFPAEAVPRYRRRNAGQPMSVGSIAVLLRKALKEAGVGRAQLFEQSDTRIRLRAHDLRATFITLALRNGRTEEWVRTRTGHKTSQMIARYRCEAETAKELGLGALLPLHEAIPELMAIGHSNASTTVELSPNCRPHAVYVQSPGSALLN